jgi:hypothetical protein
MVAGIFLCLSRLQHQSLQMRQIHLLMQMNQHHHRISRGFVVLTHSHGWYIVLYQSNCQSVCMCVCGLDAVGGLLIKAALAASRVVSSLFFSAAKTIDFGKGTLLQSQFLRRLCVENLPDDPLKVALI